MDDVSDITAYAQWFESERKGLLETWNSFSEEEKEESDMDFETFCRQEYEDSRDFSNSGI